MSNGAILYHGPSLLNGRPIVAIATGLFRPSSNEKTGPMVQAWILDATEEPHVAAKSGNDSSVCGGCRHKPTNDATCYVRVGDAPLSVYRAWKEGGYPQPKDLGALMAGRKLRIGAYGDPAAVPFEIWEACLSQAEGHTAYTHQWHVADPRLQTIAMASCDDVGDFVHAQSLGWRTFRIRSEVTDPLLEREIVCPAAPEAGKKTACAYCRICSGTEGKARANVAIVVHGSKGKINNFRLAQVG